MMRGGGGPVAGEAGSFVMWELAASPSGPFPSVLPPHGTQAPVNKVTVLM